MATPSSGGGGAGARMQGRRGGGRCGENTRRATCVLVPVPVPSDLLWRAETNVFDADFNLKHLDGETALQLV